MKKGLSINITFSNGFLYAFILIVVVLILSVTVFAFGTSTPTTFGHSIRELEAPIGCGANQFLKWSGSDWTCVSNTGIWTSNGNDISYSSGNVGIGTSNPSENLDVLGNIIATGNIVGSNVRNVACASGEFIKGFDASGNTICVIEKV